MGKQWFECGWIAVIDRNGKIGLGSSARFLLADHVSAAWTCSLDLLGWI